PTTRSDWARSSRSPVPGTRPSPSSTSAPRGRSGCSCATRRSRSSEWTAPAAAAAVGGAVRAREGSVLLVVSAQSELVGDGVLALVDLITVLVAGRIVGCVGRTVQALACDLLTLFGLECVLRLAGQISESHMCSSSVRRPPSNGGFTLDTSTGHRGRARSGPSSQDAHRSLPDSEEHAR